MEWVFSWPCSASAFQQSQTAALFDRLTSLSSINSDTTSSSHCHSCLGYFKELWSFRCNHQWSRKDVSISSSSSILRDYSRTVDSSWRGVASCIINLQADGSCAWAIVILTGPRVKINGPGHGHWPDTGSFNVSTRDP
ncbi:hypothetical protein BDV18DRAFT_15367 [Aspergillus unguis]